MTDNKQKMTKTCTLVVKALTDAGEWALSPARIFEKIKDGGDSSSIPSIYRAIKRLLQMGEILTVQVPSAPDVYTVKTNPVIAEARWASVRDGEARNLCGFTAKVYDDGSVMLMESNELVNLTLAQLYYYISEDVTMINPDKD